MRCRTNCKMSQLPLISPLFNEVNDCNSQHLLSIYFPLWVSLKWGEAKKPVSVRSIWFQRYLIVKKSVHPRICEVQYRGAFLPDKNSDKCALQHIWPIIWLQTLFNMFSCVLDLGKAKTTSLRLSFSSGSTFTRTPPSIWTQAWGGGRRTRCFYGKVLETLVFPVAAVMGPQPLALAVGVARKARHRAPSLLGPGKGGSWSLQSGQWTPRSVPDLPDCGRGQLGVLVLGVGGGNLAPLHDFVSSHSPLKSLSA